VLKRRDALAARRLAYIQVKTHTDEFDAAFQQVLENDLNQAKISGQLFCPDVSATNDHYIKLRGDKTISFAAKHSAQSKIKAPTPHTAGEKPLQKRAGRKKPEERPAPQA